MNNLAFEDIRQKQTVKFAPNGVQGIPKQDVSLNGTQKLRFISYNVWFDQHNFVERNEALRKIFLKYDPDFICLQEVTQRFMQLISQDQEICSKYYFSSSSITGYDVLILSKFPIQFQSRIFPSEMGRNLLYGVIKVNGNEFAVGTSHLESLDYNEDYRSCQLRAVHDQLKPYANSIFMGDFNFGRRSEDQNIPNDYTDVWVKLHPNEEGHTMLGNDKYSGIRFDRVILKQSAHWKPTHIEIIGQDALPLYQHKKSAPYEIVTPSDHFGLYCELTFDATTK